MALKCTKTSSPSSREMKPNPLSGLNHFTVPVVKAIPSFRGRSRTSRFDGLPAGSPAEGTARSRVMRCGNDAEPSTPQYTGGGCCLPGRLVEVVAELLRPGGVAELGERLGLDLADPLPGHPEGQADLLERRRLHPEHAEPHLDDAPLSIAEGAQDRLEMLLEQGRPGGLRWRYGVGVLDEVAEGQVLLLADRALQGDGGPEQQDLLDSPRGQVDQHADLAGIGLVAEGLEELLPGLGHLVDVFGDVDRQADGPGRGGHGPG